ncbi:MAG TPA: hypothetical protein VNF51_01765 [Candidatus Paceibacterota bacterium]|nr:hypothetical protein [Candidatus Paceibacterota bacterium]
MADIQFNEEQQYQRSAQIGRKPLFVRLVLATGIVSTDKQAEYVLLGIAFLGFFITGMFLLTGNNTTGLSNTDIQRITQLQQGAQQPRN